MMIIEFCLLNASEANPVCLKSYADRETAVSVNAETKLSGDGANSLITVEGTQTSSFKVWSAS